MNTEIYKRYAAQARVFFDQLVDLKLRIGDDEFTAAAISGLIANEYHTDFDIVFYAAKWLGEEFTADVKDCLDQFNGPSGLWNRGDDGTYRLN